MRKKVKSFTIEEGPYEELFKLFKENYVDVSISYCLNKYIKEFLAYLQPIQDQLKADKSLSVPMSFVIETAAREPSFKMLNQGGSTGGAGIAPEVEARELQRKYEAHIGRGSEAQKNEQIEELDNLEATVKFAKALTKVIMKGLKDRREPTDDEVGEIVREVGGKPLQKAIRERIGPFMDKIDPPVGEVLRRVRRGKKTDGGER